MGWLFVAFQVVRVVLLLAAGPGAVPFIVEWDTTPDMPRYGFDRSASPDDDPIERLINYAQGIVVVVGVIGILYSAGKMAIGKLGQSDVAADGVGGTVWVILGVCLMLVAIPVATTLAGVRS